MDTLTKECYGNLANAIIIQAVGDYTKALKNKRYMDKHIVKECEEFFRSEWFGILTNVDSEIIISECKKERERIEKRNPRNKSFNRVR